MGVALGEWRDRLSLAGFACRALAGGVVVGGAMADRVIRVFISSPSDVRPERGIAARVVQRLAREFSYYFRVEPVLWEREPLLASHHFQELITPPRQTDIVVVVLWSRLGMPLPDEAKWAGPLSGRRVTGTEWEFEDALASYRERAMPDLMLYRKRAKANPESDRQEAVEDWLRQRDLVEDFMRRWFRDSEGKSATAASWSFTDGAAFEAMLEEHLRALLRKRLSGSAEGATIRWHRGSPYRGLEAFEPEHEQIFFGRTRARNEVRELLARQAARGNAFVLVMGASGSGKSSLVKAGVLPELREAGMVGQVALVRHAITRPGAASDSVSGLAAALFTGTALPELAEPPLGYTAETMTDLLRRVPEEAMQPIRKALSAAGRAAGLTAQGEARLLVVIDQLEEMFTAEGATAEGRERYVAALRALASSGVAWVIATMRSDFFDRLERLPALAALAQGEAKYLLTAPDGSEIGQIIRQPAREAGVRFEVDEKAGQSLDEVIQEVAARDAGSLPLLEYLLDQLWHCRTENGILTYAAYHDLGGLEGAIGRRAEAVLASQAAEVQAALPRLLRALVTVRPGIQGAVTARYARIEQFREGGAELRLIAALLDPQARLLAAAGDALRVTHEALLTHWPRARDQIARDRSDLQLRARLEDQSARWQAATGNDRESLLLMAGLPLSEAEDLLGRRRDELDPDLVDYIERSGTLVRQRQRRTTRRLQAAAATFATLAVGAGIGAWFGFTGQQRAEEQTGIAEGQTKVAKAEREEADRSRQRAEAQRREAQSQEARAVSTLARQSIATGDAQGAMLAALAVLPHDSDDSSRPLSPEAIMTLYEGWLRNREVMTLIGHREAVNGAMFSPDGRRVVTASSDGTARVWDVSGMHPSLAAVLEGHTSIVLGVAFSPDGRRVATTSADGTARVWSLDGKTPDSMVLKGHQRSVLGAAFSLDGRRVVTASEDGTARVWDVSGVRPIGPMVLAGHTDIVYGAQFSPDGKRVLTRSRDITARVWDVSGKDPVSVMVLEGHTVAVLSAAFSRDGRHVVTASSDQTARVWDVSGNRPVAMVLQGHGGGVSGAAFSPDGRRVITSSNDGKIGLWDVTGDQPRVVTALEGYTDPVNVRFSPDGRRVLTASYQGRVRVWDISKSPATAVELVGHRGLLTDAEFSPDGRRVLTASADRTARVWDVDRERTTVAEIEVESGAVLGRWLSPDGRRAATVSTDGTARIWEIDGTRAVARVLEGHKGKIERAVFSPDGRRLVVAQPDGTTRLWDVGGDRPTVATVLEEQKGSLWSAGFSRDGRRLVTVSNPGIARAWDFDGEPRFAELAQQGGEKATSWHTAAISPDGRHIVTVSLDGAARIWDVSGQRPAVAVELERLACGFAGTAFSPDGRRVLIVCDGMLRVWDVGNERAAATLVSRGEVQDRNEGAVRGAVFNRDGRRVLMWLANGTARLIDISGERQITVILPGRQGVLVADAAFDSEGRVVTFLIDGTVRTWPMFVDEHDFVPLARKSLTRCLTARERAGFGLSVVARPAVDSDAVSAPPCD